MAVLDYFNMLTSGDFLEAIISPYYDLLGNWFWVWFFALMLLVLYNKTQNFGTVGIVSLVIAGHMFPLFPPVVHLMGYILLAISVTIILYRAYH